jgi:hypothetical protein
MNLIFETLKSAERPNAPRAAADVDVLDAPSSSPSRSSVGPSGGDMVAVSARPPTHASQNRRERRKQKRAGVKLAARIRPADLKNGNFYEVLVTVNASRQSLYFTTASEHYHLGMRLRVTFPYNSAHDSVTASEADGEVTRTERLPDKRVGVAVELRGPAHTAGSSAGTAGPSVSRGAVGERRLASRYPFSAGAVVVDSHASMRLQARCSDLSLEGCYIDTLNPFPEGTLAHVELRRAERVFEAVARVNSSHMGMGMGLGFQELTPEQTSVLVHWLCSEHGERLWVAGPSEIFKQAESLDRTQVINLVRQLLTKGILTKADLSALFFDPGLL